MTLAELMNNYSSIYGEVVTALDVAKRHLRIRLFDGPISSERILRGAAIKGISQATLRRAKNKVGVVVRKDGPLVVGQRTWRWHLPLPTHGPEGARSEQDDQKSLGRES
jgi:hypothetical protein